MRKLTEEDRTKTLEYIAKEPEMNLFIFGDLENYGFEGATVSVYAEERSDGEWDFILLKYFDFYIIYSKHNDYDAAAAYNFLQGKTVDCISGKTEIVEPLARYYGDKKLKNTYMSRINAVSRTLAEEAQKVCVKKVGAKDVKDVSALLETIDEFDGIKGEDGLQKNIEQQISNLEHGGTLVCVYNNGKPAATASTSAANSVSAMVVAVATLPEFRRRGYATAAVVKLCLESFGEGKRFLCLFYDNPQAGRIYRRIGFEEIGRYSMLR